MEYTKAKEYLEPDNIWEAFGIHSHEEFIKTMVPTLILKPNIPEDIKKELEILNCLLVHAYYRYQFFDIAANKSLQIMEMAFKIKYRELTGEMGHIKKALWQLIRELDKNNLFEDGIGYVNRMREMRNIHLHPDRHSFGGSMYTNIITGVVQIINELYEDIPLRIKRKLIKGEIETYIKENLSGDIEIIIGKTKIPVHRFWPVLIDNKETEHICHLFMIPLFPLAPYKNWIAGKSIRVPRVYTFELKNLKMIGNEISALDRKSNEKIVIRNIVEANVIKAVKRWKSEFEILKTPHHIDHSWGFNVGLTYFYLLEKFTIKNISL